MVRKVVWSEATLSDFNQGTGLVGLTHLSDIWEVALRVFLLLYADKRSVYENLESVLPHRRASFEETKQKAVRTITSAARKFGRREFHGNFANPVVFVESIDINDSRTLIRFHVVVECHSTGRGLIAIRSIACSFVAQLRGGDSSAFRISDCSAHARGTPAELGSLYEESFLESIRARSLAYRNVVHGGLPGLGKR